MVGQTARVGSGRIGSDGKGIASGDRILLVDDLIATGGTACAAVDLIRQSGGDLVGASFVIDLPDLGGRQRLEKQGVSVRSLMEFEGD